MDKVRFIEFDRALDLFDRNDGSIKIIRSIEARIADLRKELIVQQIINEAINAGMHELILLDRNFVLEALKEKLEREKEKENA